MSQFARFQNSLFQVIAISSKDEIKDIYFKLKTTSSSYIRISEYLITPAHRRVAANLEKRFSDDLSLLLKFEVNIKLYCVKFAQLF